MGYVFDALTPLSEADLGRTVICGAPHSVMQAINRQVAHYSSHIGQIIFLAKHSAGQRAGDAHHPAEPVGRIHSPRRGRRNEPAELIAVIALSGRNWPDTRSRAALRPSEGSCRPFSLPFANSDSPWARSSRSSIHWLRAPVLWAVASSRPRCTAPSHGRSQPARSRSCSIVEFAGSAVLAFLEHLASGRATRGWSGTGGHGTVRLNAKDAEATSSGRMSPPTRARSDHWLRRCSIPSRFRSPRDPARSS